MIVETIHASVTLASEMASQRAEVHCRKNGRSPGTRKPASVFANICRPTGTQICYGVGEDDDHFQTVGVWKV